MAPGLTVRTDAQRPTTVGSVRAVVGLRKENNVDGGDNRGVRGAERL